MSEQQQPYILEISLLGYVSTKKSGKENNNATKAKQKWSLSSKNKQNEKMVKKNKKTNLTIILTI